MLFYFAKYIFCKVIFLASKKLYCLTAVIFAYGKWYCSLCSQLWINFALCPFFAFLYKHSLVAWRNARRSGAEKGSAEHQTRVRSCGCAVIFLHQRNEWHNEWYIPNVREPSVALPVGLCRRQKGETREEGGHALRGLCTEFIKKSTPFGELFTWIR